MKRVLVISPHPDDEAIACGGTICNHVANGDAVRVIFLTSGEKGGHGRSTEQTRELRQAEARKAAKVLRLEQIEFWDQPDGGLRASQPIVKRLQSVLAQWGPDLIYAPHEREQHPDHRAALRLVQKALRRKSSRNGKPTVRLFEVWTPLQRMNHIEDISRQIERKLAAIKVYETQCAEVEFVEAFRGLARYRGEMHCWPEGSYAEVFAKLRSKKP